ncbi:MAG: hypothetical protein R3F61_22500 [Myxococcota bacterium]
MMLLQTSASTPDLGGMTVGQALFEPAAVAAGWMQAPPWAMLAVLLLTIALIALTHRVRPETAGSA